MIHTLTQLPVPCSLYLLLLLLPTSCKLACPFWINATLCASLTIAAAVQAQGKAEVVQLDINKNGLGEAICKHANDLPAAMVVMAASSRGKRIRYVLGPTTEYCVGRCAHPVLVYHS